MRPARRSRRLSVATLAALAALLLAACGSGTSSPSVAPSPTVTPAATPAPTAAATASPSAQAAASVSIKLQKGWQRVELTEAALKAQIKTTQKSNAQLAATLQQVLDSGTFKNMKFYALGYSGVKPIGNINVIAIPLGGASLDAFRPVIEGEFKQLGATGINFHEAMVADAPSLVVDYELTVKGPTGNSVAMTGRAYLVPVEDVAYDITVTCFGTSVSACLASGDKMANSLTVTH